ncbi:hypothetical protein H6A66_12650 [Bacteroides caecigallinarum]|uniref:DUF6562 domain-containing protein n=1 Tax=Bacteroides caecigallinarum TaxID=1411144 RepID=UPI001956086F|nr:DUF6562 domain-containing protein [Bacteroides caecigallinarum]MBM6866010.1 hypothetical protein [Bacteroides caecigallinarum]
MKRNFILALSILLVGVSSCTQENLKNIDTLAPVTMTVNLPSSIDGNVSRSLPSAPEGHSLRCIMVVDYSSAEDQRIEKVATGSEVNGVFRFSFTPVEESYNCLFWADYVGEDGTDKYYNTENIENITYKLSDNSIFNNPACDAFYGKALNGTTSVTLKRPFVKLSFVDKNQQTVSESSSLSVVYSVPSGFNVKDNTTASTQEIKLENAAPADKANSTWFYNYVFAASDDNKLGDISMTVDDRTNIVKGENIPLEANYEITASIDFASANGNVNVDVDIDDEYVDPDAPKIAQFLQKDGSFSDSYDENNSVAIVFAVGPKGKDTTGNYDQKFDGKKIWGYAMGLSSVSRKALTTSETPFDLTEIAIESPWATDDYNGYVYTQKFMEAVNANSLQDSQLMTEYEAWKTTNSVSGLENVSGWYIPSSRQLLDVMGMTLGYTGIEGEEPYSIVKDEVFAGLVNSLITTEKSWFGTHTSASNVMSSSVSVSGQIMAVQTTFNEGTETISKALGVSVNSKASTFAIRPVITIFSK